MKAALLEVISGMFRFYRAVLALAMMTAAASAAAQTARPPEQPLLGSTFTPVQLRDLPTANNPFAVPETIQLETIADLFSAGGLNAATAPKIGGLLNSWTQTQYRIGDVSITDPRAGGTPLLLPILSSWQRITTATGAMGIEDNASGLSITLEPPRPGATWMRAFEGTLSGSALVSQGTGTVPAIDRVSQWQDANVLVSGPVTEHLGFAAAGSWRGLSHVAAPSLNATSDHVASGFAHLVFAATPRDEVRAFGWAQQITTATLTDSAIHAQATWERRDPALSWRVFGGYTGRTRTAPLTPTLIVDSLLTDPISDLVDTGAGTTRRWVAGARVAAAEARRLPTVGVDVEGAEGRIASSGITRINELVNGTPARAWAYTTSGTDVRQFTTFAAYANEHMTAGRLALDGGVRLDTVTGNANGASRGISWTNLLPRASARLQIFNTADVSASASYRRTAYQPTLNLLAVGDPAAPVADVSSWNGTSVGPLIARVGPGTGGDAAFAQIDPNVQRPTTDELVLALRARPRPGLELALARVTKREQSLFGYVDTGVLASDYTAFSVPDPSFLPGSPVGAPQVTAYNRPAGSYGRDRYLLTNQAGEPARSWGLELTVRATTERFTLLVGGNLTWAVGPAAAASGPCPPPGNFPPRERSLIARAALC